MPGVTKKTVNLFDANGGADETANLNMPIFVIPTDENLKITIVYDVETYDSNLAQFLSDGAAKGSSIQNTIEKEITREGQAFQLEAGKVYTIGLHLGLTSVKFDASVTEWTNETTNVDLPGNKDNNNQPAPAGPFTAAAMGMALAAWECKDLGEKEQLDFLEKASENISHARPTTVKRMQLITEGCLDAVSEIEPQENTMGDDR